MVHDSSEIILIFLVFVYVAFVNDSDLYESQTCFFSAILKKFLFGSLFYYTASRDSRLLQVTLRGRLPRMFNPKLEAFYSQSLNVPLCREYVLNLRQGISQKCSPVYDLFKTVGYIQIRYNTGKSFWHIEDGTLRSDSGTN
jgi:hypothetical protein